MAFTKGHLFDSLGKYVEQPRLAQLKVIDVLSPDEDSVPTVYEDVRVVTTVKKIDVCRQIPDFRKVDLLRHMSTRHSINSHAILLAKRQQSSLSLLTLYLYQ